MCPSAQIHDHPCSTHPDVDLMQVRRRQENRIPFLQFVLEEEVMRGHQIRERRLIQDSGIRSKAATFLESQILASSFSSACLVQIFYILLSVSTTLLKLSTFPSPFAVLPKENSSDGETECLLLITKYFLLVCICGGSMCTVDYLNW